MSIHNWRMSNPHLLLLSKFLSPKNKNDFSKTDNWRIVLRESPQQAIIQFVNEGLLIHGEIEEKLDYIFKAAELKNLLKNKGLQTSGKKADFIHRLINADLAEMTRLSKGIDVFSLTKKGRELVDQYLANMKEKRDIVEKEVIGYLQQRNFRAASMTVANFEAEQVFPRGMGIDWKHHNPSRDIEVLSNIFSNKPKILAKLDDNLFEKLRIASCMMFLSGTNHGKEWLPANFETGLFMDNDAAIRMISFNSLQKANIANYHANSDVVTGVQISAVPDACEACKKISGKEFTLDNFLELLYEFCTSNKGCRCTLLPVVMRPPNLELKGESVV